VGLISEFNGYEINAAKESNNAAILANALFHLGLVCWSIETKKENTKGVKKEKRKPTPSSTSALSAGHR